MIKKNKGCLCENLAVVWLQEQGYYVYKGSQTQSPIDIIAINPKTLESKFFDVKHVGRRKNGSIISRSPRIKDKRIQILSVDLINKKCRIVPRRNITWT
tara:strand:+ start:411 stop:707 length:297 start_codon:yes stop_codon:yes gene_type:complete